MGIENSKLDINNGPKDALDETIEEFEKAMQRPLNDRMFGANPNPTPNIKKGSPIIDRYVGQRNAQDQMDGFGTLLLLNGDSIEGQFRQDDIFGNAILKQPSIGCTYQGQFEYSKKNGQGILTMSGKKYIGSFRDDHCDGIGTVILRNGDCYEGEFSFGQPSGFGILVQSEYRFEGYWKEGKKHGLGFQTDQTTKTETFGFWHDDSLKSTISKHEFYLQLIWRFCVSPVDIQKEVFYFSYEMRPIEENYLFQRVFNKLSYLELSALLLQHQESFRQRRGKCFLITDEPASVVNVDIFLEILSFNFNVISEFDIFDLWIPISNLGGSEALITLECVPCNAILFHNVPSRVVPVNKTQRLNLKIMFKSAASVRVYFMIRIQMGEVTMRQLCFVQASVLPIKTLKNFVFFDARALLYGSVIGKGGFGTVRSVDMRRNDIAIKKVAVKSIGSLSTLNDHSSIRSVVMFFKELRICCALSGHPNIVSVVGACIEWPNYSLVLELLPMGDLAGWLEDTSKSEKFLTISSSQTFLLISSFISDIIRSIKHMHKSGYLHRDVKTSNFLICSLVSAPFLKLTDFGSATTIKSNSNSLLQKSSNEFPSLKPTPPQSPTNSQKKLLIDFSIIDDLQNNNLELDLVGTLPWMATEVVLDQNAFSQQSDIYSVGMTIWEILSRLSLGNYCIPYYESPNSKMSVDKIQQMKRDGILPSTKHFSNLSEKYKPFEQLYQKCTLPDPNSRPFDLDDSFKLNSQ